MDRIAVWRLSLCVLLQCCCVCCQLSGWVESPGYPRTYLPFASLNWSRCAPEGHVLTLTLTHLDLEDSQDCGNDAVEVLSNGNLISVLCGKRTYAELLSSVNPSLLSLPGGCLSLSFHSDYSNVRRHSGFRGFYTVRDFNECNEDPDNGCTQFCHNFIGGYRCSCNFGYQLDTDGHTCTVSCTEDLSGLKEGVISIPSLPGAAYAENSHCLYILSVEDHLQFELHFSKEFDVQEGPDGECIDSLMVETDYKTLGPFCTHTPPSSLILTQSHQVHIRFTSDGFGTNYGFNVEFKTRAKTCPGLIIPRSSVEPQKLEFSSGDTVKVTCDLGYFLDELDEIESTYTSTCQKSGTWSPVYNCEPVDCGMPKIAHDDVLRLEDDTNTLFNDEIWFHCISEYYALERNESYVCNASGSWVSASGKTEFPRCVEVCGVTSNDILTTGRILGGRAAKLGEIPWQLFVREPRRGGASLINDQWAVTAAHVVDDVEETTVALYGGLADALTVVDKPSDVQVMDVHKIIVHPKYEKFTGSVQTNYDNDIALIRMASRVKLGPNLIPICLPEANEGLQENQVGTVSGWGTTERAEASRWLRHADISVYSRRQCQDTPIHKGKHLAFTENMFCAGMQGRDSCSKDSGGPFVLPSLGNGNKNGMGPYRLRGIVSWGPPCEEKQFKGYYTKVENYLDWIQETMERVEKAEQTSHL
ncbi:complement C1s subcomponent [Lampris incognitus]|uniref:complement C1s subcomponent n=1 Tax=Lampris incognitus TaxID=2546036 RepID=UPI0024B518E5|nr:complement C1s subcomponent [Lampris incognitus]